MKLTEDGLVLRNQLTGFLQSASPWIRGLVIGLEVDRYRHIPPVRSPADGPDSCRVSNLGVVP